MKKFIFIMFLFVVLSTFMYGAAFTVKNSSGGVVLTTSNVKAAFHELYNSNGYTLEVAYGTYNAAPSDLYVENADNLKIIGILNGSSKPTFDGNYPQINGENIPHGLRLRNCSNVKIKKLHFREYHATGIRVEESNNVLIKRCKVTDIRPYTESYGIGGIDTYSCDNVTIQNNNVIVQGPWVKENGTVYEYKQREHCIYTTYSTGYVKIFNNTCTGSGIKVRQSKNVRPETFCNDLQIYSNTVTNPYYAILLTEGRDDVYGTVSIHDNVINGGDHTAISGIFLYHREEVNDTWVCIQDIGSQINSFKVEDNQFTVGSNTATGDSNGMHGKPVVHFFDTIPGNSLFQNNVYILDDDPEDYGVSYSCNVRKTFADFRSDYEIVWAKLTSHSTGDTLSGATVTFEWDPGNNVDLYDLDIGATQGGVNYYDGDEIPDTELTVSGLPVGGGDVWVRLNSIIDGVSGQKYYDYRLTAALAEKASFTRYKIGDISTSLIGYIDGGVLKGKDVTFFWDIGQLVERIGIDVGTSRGGNNIHDGNGYPPGEYSSQSVIIESVEPDPNIWVRLLSRINGSWYQNYQDISFKGVLSELSAPQVGTTLTGPTVTFSWTRGVDVTRAGIDVFDSNKNCIYDGDGYSWTTKHEQIINNIPTYGTTIKVRILSLIDGKWYYNDYYFNTADID